MGSDSLRDQLLGLGFKPSAKPDAKPGARPGADRRPGGAGKPGGHKAAKPHPRSAEGRNRPSHAGTNKPAADGRPGKPRGDIDLAKAYAIRAQKEKQERVDAEREKQEQARQRREAKARLAQLLKGQALNDPDADIARHFPYGGKIKRVYVNPAQLQQLNAGELGVVQVDGRYVLVSAQVLEQVSQVFAPAVALKVESEVPADAGGEADPRHQVPDDLVW